MKNLKSLTSFGSLTLIVLLSSLSLSCTRTADPEMRLWYSQPALASIQDDPNGWRNDPEWLKALPVGNGSLGAMVYGDVGLERIQLNEKSLWSGSPDDNDNPLAYGFIDSIRNLLYAGKYREAHILAEQTQVCKGAGSGHGNGANVPFGCFQTLGDLWMHFDRGDSYTDYYRDLNLMNGITSVSYEQDGIRFERKVFSSYPDQVLVIHLTASEKGSISFTCGMNRPERYETLASGDQLIMRGQMTDGKGGGGMKYITRLKPLARGGTVIWEDSTFTVRDADAVTLLLTAATSYRQQYPTYEGNDYEGISLENLNRAEQKTYARLMKDHTADFQGLMQRVDFDITPAVDPDTIPVDIRLERFRETGSDDRLAELYFQYGRYLLVSSSRKGSLPANLQGLWANKIQTPWNADYHTDINVQMNYWPVEVTNLAECQMPLTELIESLVIPGAHTAQVHYQASGWVVHPITNVFGFTAPGEHPSWGLHLGAGAWMAQHLWEHYRFTLDEEYLRRVYPVMLESARFYLDWLVEDPITGMLVSGPASSPENRFIAPDGTRGYLTMGPTHDQQVIWDLFTNLVEASAVLKIEDVLIATVALARDRLFMPGIGSDGRLMEWPVEFEEPEPGHRHMSHLFALHPGRQISAETPELQRAARRSLEYRLEHGGGHTGWSAAWLVNLWARLGEGDEAKKAIDLLLRKCTTPNFFDLHPPFQIDGNFGGTAGIAEMLIQSHTGKIVLLPALPASWPDGRVKGLMARGGVEVEMDWKEGQLKSFGLKSREGGSFIVLYEGEEWNFDLKKGQTIRHSL